MMVFICICLVGRIWCSGIPKSARDTNPKKQRRNHLIELRDQNWRFATHKTPDIPYCTRETMTTTTTTMMMKFLLCLCCSLPAAAGLFEVCCSLWCARIQSELSTHRSITASFTLKATRRSDSNKCESNIQTSNSTHRIAKTACVNHDQLHVCGTFQFPLSYAHIIKKHMSLLIILLNLLISDRSSFGRHVYLLKPKVLIVCLQTGRDRIEWNWT